MKETNPLLGPGEGSREQKSPLLPALMSKVAVLRILSILLWNKAAPVMSSAYASRDFTLHPTGFVMLILIISGLENLQQFELRVPMCSRCTG